MDSSCGIQNSYNLKMNEIKCANRPQTLNLQGSAGIYNSRPKGNSATPNPVLSSPDINNFKMTTPEVEKFIINGNLLLTPTLNTPPCGTKPPTELFPGPHAYGDNFNVDSDSNQGNLIAELSKSHNNGGNNTSTANSYINIDNQQYPIPVTMSSYELDHVIIKEEPQTVPSIGSSPPQSPINMESQERLKLERKRQRNRVAAHKCRKRKLERIAKLEDKVKTLKGENMDLNQMLVKLKEEVCMLKEKVMRHHQNGCPILPAPLSF